MLDFLKKILFYFWNPNILQIRDSNGKIVEDWKRRKHSKQLQSRIDSGEIKIGDKPRCLKRKVKGQVSVEKRELT